jgi:cell division protein FtsW (lipid II flippase)
LMQAFINIGVNMSLLPLTGLTLPFFSHWGSALLINIIEVVLLRKITKK